MSDTPPEERAGDRSPWNWLLIPPIVIPLLTFLFNFDEPRLLGFPAFYWLQLAFIVLGVICTSVVYQMTKRKRSAE
ncbi:DUF3311 domain-containing protein [Bailinhaonella thermotolerans]|uniref:DUF3311 domain-containing protein n=1 Tax=Bailinhaonella thermotolerans TaxID=1070861 RepID=A0A3A4A778_9ACTN|nr:DUF3311 domain-containing protein [Bailinhaonella thermotolerans]RJL20805.1 DUF3311 domain-containing protein [Bailinhaonella thermotolerans]